MSFVASVMLAVDVGSSFRGVKEASLGAGGGGSDSELLLERIEVCATVEGRGSKRGWENDGGICMLLSWKVGESL